MPPDEPQAVVYVIDDDQNARESFAFLLEVAGMTVVPFESADAFLDAAPPPAGACIVADVRMPGTGGIELTEQLAQRDVRVPIILITGHADVPLAIRAMKAGAADFIEKPFDDAVILSAIRNALRQAAGDIDSRLRQEVLDRLTMLSERELEVMEGVIAGLSDSEIAFDLAVSMRTVELARDGMMAKMQATTLSDLVRLTAVANSTAA